MKKRHLKIFPLAVMLLLAGSCKEDIVTAQSSELPSAKTKPASVSYVDRYIDGEDASINTSARTLLDNGGTYPLRTYGQGVLATIEGRYSKGSRGLMATVNPNTDGTYDRSEIEVKTGLPMSTDRVVGFDMYVDGSFSSAPSGPLSARWFIFSQLWQYSPAMPPIALEIVPGSDLQYQVILRNDVTGPVAATAPNPYPIRYTGNLVRNKWIRFVLHFNANPNGGAFFKLYQDGVLKYSTTGKIGYSTAYSTSQYLDWRVGIYRTGGVAWPLQHIWFDEMKYGNILSEVL